MTEEEIKNPENQLPEVIADEGIRIIGPSDNSVECLIDCLLERGIAFNKTDVLARPSFGMDEIEIYVNVKIDPIIKRCAAKIAFNYLTYTAGRDFVLDKAFNETRDYIRYEKSPDHPLTKADDEPILFDDSVSLRQTDGHLITVNWTPDKRNIVGQLSLFNRVTYRVSLGYHFSGAWRPIRSGHHFDPASRKITQLSVASLTVN